MQWHFFPLSLNAVSRSFSIDLFDTCDITVRFLENIVLRSNVSERLHLRGTATVVMA